jgi:hypothetical protein
MPQLQNVVFLDCEPRLLRRPLSCIPRGTGLLGVHILLTQLLRQLMAGPIPTSYIPTWVVNNATGEP